MPSCGVQSAMQNLKNNYYDFEHVNFRFSQNFISLFCGLFNDETDLRVRVSKLVQMDVQTKFD